MKDSRTVLVLGGMHGNEPLGIELVRLLQTKPIPGVEAVIANPRAVKVVKRFSESDLNRSFGNVFKGTYEWRRARQLKKLCQTYDLVLDFHNTQASNNNCTFVGPKSNSELLAVSQQLGLDRCIQVDYDCVNKYCPNALSIEISQGDKLDSSQYWYQQLKDLQDGRRKLQKQLQMYRFVRRVSWAEAKVNDFKSWQAFKPLTLGEKRALGLKGSVVPIFIGSTLTEYYATLLRKEKVK